MTGCFAQPLPLAVTPNGERWMPASMLVSCLASHDGPESASCAASPPTGPQPARGGWMTQSHQNSLPLHTTPGIPDQCSPSPHSHHPPLSGHLSAPRGMRAIVAFAGAATTATSTPSASSLDTATRSAPHPRQVHGPYPGERDIPVSQSQARQVEPPYSISSPRDKHEPHVGHIA